MLSSNYYFFSSIQYIRDEKKKKGMKGRKGKFQGDFSFLPSSSFLFPLLTQFLFYFSF